MSDGTKSAPPAPLDLRAARMRAELAVLQQALAQSQGDIREAARLLGITRPTLYDLLRTHGLMTREAQMTQRRTYPPGSAFIDTRSRILCANPGGLPISDRTGRVIAMVLPDPANHGLYDRYAEQVRQQVEAGRKAVGAP